MTVPGSNLLNQALSIIAAQTLTYIAYKSRATNDQLQYVNTYAAPKTTKGSLQPVSRQLMQQLGLDLTRSYVNIFISQKVIDVQRDVSNDKFEFNGWTYDCLSITPWVQIDGWNQVLAVRVP